jgi:hypothetical protein
MYLDEYFKRNIIENKFINLLNEKDYDAALKYICKRENKISKNNNFEIIKFLN